MRVLLTEDGKPVNVAGLTLRRDALSVSCPLIFRRAGCIMVRVLAMQRGFFIAKEDLQ
jgi:hypothetical protein